MVGWFVGFRDKLEPAYYKLDRLQLMNATADTESPKDPSHGRFRGMLPPCLLRDKLCICRDGCVRGCLHIPESARLRRRLLHGEAHGHIIKGGCVAGALSLANRLPVLLGERRWLCHPRVIQRHCGAPLSAGACAQQTEKKRREA